MKLRPTTTVQCSQNAGDPSGGQQRCPHAERRRKRGGTAAALKRAMDVLEDLHSAGALEGVVAAASPPPRILDRPPDNPSSQMPLRRSYPPTCSYWMRDELGFRVHGLGCPATLRIMWSGRSHVGSCLCSSSLCLSTQPVFERASGCGPEASARLRPPDARIAARGSSPPRD